MSKIQKSLDFMKKIGGVQGAFWRFLREGTARVGTCVGEDKYGNKYYENDWYFFSRNRWVVYPYAGRLEYDGSQILPEWHRWMHYMTDETPVQSKPVQRKFLMDHERNYTGTKREYVPYSTTRPKIESWQPPKNY
ncbi:NADH dehydrogenase [ubiquinone] 1 alpha subcomplex subunit 12-like [Actinia tenebrosa]|uniref:NADH dehydrogenase [ubiquinone] 1 alpha subcomplex subunit 12 n=1 Tax=Actinia tenebrosa TaxID=6105 RepID=A0A6P8HZ81_ACTTE|nr:NADH dehydrogenase [ubiquinone] 1 alpha subcomplex subunit 12-like [Actinia tenebrosa]